MHAVIDFVKMEGAGNDYVYVDAIRNPFDLDQAPAFAARVADRHFGVGADGLILLMASEIADVRMRMWNSDGSQGSMCGNGVRCLAKLAHDHGHVTTETLTVETDAGIKAVSLRFDAGQAIGARVEMGAVRVSLTPVELEVEGHSYQYFQVDAGNPHAVVFVEGDPRQLAVAAIGAAIQALPCFPEGVNVEVVQVRSDATIMQRTFERGSGETLACGSGATAVACAAIELQKVHGPEVVIELLGGCLVVEVTDSGVFMEGPARTVYRGQIAADAIS